MSWEFVQRLLNIFRQITGLFQIFFFRRKKNQYFFFILQIKNEMKIGLGYLWSDTSVQFNSGPVQAGVVKLPAHALSVQHQGWSWHKLLHLELAPEQVSSDNHNLSEAA